MPSPKFAVVNGAGEPITSLPAGLEDGENIFEAAVKAAQAHNGAAQQTAVREPERVDTAPPHDETSEAPTTEELESVEQQPAPVKPKGPYPADMPLFAYKFPTGIEVQLPLKVEQPDPVFLWELHDKPFHFVSWRWMAHAQVPRSIQRLVVSHMQNYGEQYEECFTQWFKQLNGGATPGE